MFGCWLSDYSTRPVTPEPRAGETTELLFAVCFACPQSDVCLLVAGVLPSFVHQLLVYCLVLSLGCLCTA